MPKNKLPSRFTWESGDIKIVKPKKPKKTDK